MTNEQVASDPSTLSRFRTALTKTKTFEKLFASINKQLETHNIIIRTGLIIDASAIDTPLRPKGKTTFKVSEDICEDQVEVHKEYAASVDKEGTWLKKKGKHHITYNESLVLGVPTTTASKNEIANLEEVLETVNVVLPKDIPRKADKGYQSKKNTEILKQRNLKNHILKKAVKNKPLTKWETRFNQLIGKTRFKVARTFDCFSR
jgi:IS5 family transposase